MFESLRDAFRQAVENFRRELGRDDAPGAFARIHRDLSRELDRADGRLRALEAELARVREEAAAEGREAAVCLRREELALRIRDAETARLAREFSERHVRRREILEEKGHVLAIELRDRRDELDGMRTRLREILTDPDGLPGVAELGDPG
jgi:hypothetical protein